MLLGWVTSGQFKSVWASPCQFLSVRASSALSTDWLVGFDQRTTFLIAFDPAQRLQNGTAALLSGQKFSRSHAAVAEFYYTHDIQ